ncbi:MAG TPA: hypothetical protein VNN72_28145 [Polyangiaceae bacterium]|nr:hypothetical protein [Polyangiaceae bacterium]
MAFVLAALPLACGSSTSDDSPASGGTSGTSGTGNNPPPLEPAMNLDVTTCASIHTIEDDASSHCSTCCDAVDATASSFINKGACTCKLLEADDPAQTICDTATADGDTCGACCSGHGYLAYGWVGGDAQTHTEAFCGCSSLQDKTVCAAYTQSEEACGNCCMHEGFISMGYGTVGCWCIG